MTTYTAFVNALEAVVVSGVNRRYLAGPPVQLSTADLPAQWCDVPKGEETAACANTGGELRTLTADLVIAVEAVGQNLRLNNWPACVTMLDSLTTALRTWDGPGGSSPLMGPLTWRSRLVIVTAAQNDWWAVLTTCEALG